MVAVIAAGAFALGLSLYKADPEKVYSKQTYVYQPARTINDFNLIDDNGSAFTQQDLQGKWSFVFLGYISCPDICPMTLAKFSGVIPKLETVVKQPAQVLFLSVDPKRDTQDLIAQYTDYFHDNIVGLRAEHKDLFPFVRNLGLMYSIPTDEQEDSYFVDHSASVVLVNPKGQIAAIFKPEFSNNQVPIVNMNTLLADFKTLAQG